MDSSFAFGLLLVFEVAGWWQSALVYGGIMRKVGQVPAGVGFVPPTPANIALVVGRVRELMPTDIALMLYGGAVLLRTVLVAWVAFHPEPSVAMHESNGWHGGPVGARAEA